jgi:hypothetical protein
MSQTRTGDASRAVLLYVGLLGAAALALLIPAMKYGPLPDDWTAVVVLCVLSFLSWRTKGERVAERTALSFASIIILASVALTGPLGAAVVGAVSPLAGVRQQPAQQRIFNVAMNSLIAGFAAFVYVWAGGLPAHRVVAKPLPLIDQIGLPLIAADVAMCVANALLLAGVMRLSRGVPLRRFVSSMFASTGFAYIGYGLIGFLFVILWVPAEVGPFSALLVLLPLFVARWAFVQFSDENNAHERTLNALVAAVETKAARTRGHSERVARLCDVIAGAMGLNHTDIASLRYAGMLHDVGLLGVPSRILRKVDDLSDAEMDSIRQHPAEGADIVRDIEFLKPALNGIEHHHERFDGRGYPVGLAGDDIPLFARIVAVADAFESLTTSNVERAALTVTDALEEIEHRSGTQFDPVVVAALHRGLARVSWTSRTLDLSTVASGGRGYDHDDPSQSDAMAGLRPRGVGRGSSSPDVDGAAW